MHTKQFQLMTYINIFNLYSLIIQYNISKTRLIIKENCFIVNSYFNMLLIHNGLHIIENKCFCFTLLIRCENPKDPPVNKSHTFIIFSMIIK